MTFSLCAGPQEAYRKQKHQMSVTHSSLGLIAGRMQDQWRHQANMRTTGSVHAQAPSRNTEGANGGLIDQPDKVRWSLWRSVVHRHSKRRAAPAVKTV